MGLQRNVYIYISIYLHNTYIYIHIHIHIYICWFAGLLQAIVGKLLPLSGREVVILPKDSAICPSLYPRCWEQTSSTFIYIYIYMYILYIIIYILYLPCYV